MPYDGIGLQKTKPLHIEKGKLNNRIKFSIHLKILVKNLIIIIYKF